jgi:hypothetical protein
VYTCRASYEYISKVFRGISGILYDPQHSTVLGPGLPFSPIQPDHFFVEQDQTLVVPMASRFFHVYDVQRISEPARISEERFWVHDRVLDVLG